MDLATAESVYDALVCAATFDDLAPLVQRFARVMDHDNFICDAVLETRTGRTANTLHNYSHTWIDRASRIPEPLYRLDPVFEHIDHRSEPIVWSGSTYAAAGVGEIWEESSAAGIASGVAVGVRGTGGLKLTFGLSRGDKTVTNSTEARNLMAHVLLFGTCLSSRVSDVLRPPLREERPSLTRRELDVLNWTRAGKTAWELGQILGISYGTASFHLQNAQRKLEATDKHQAVLRALDYRLLN